MKKGVYEVVVVVFLDWSCFPLHVYYCFCNYIIAVVLLYYSSNPFRVGCWQGFINVIGPLSLPSKSLKHTFNPYLPCLPANRITPAWNSSTRAAFVAHTYTSFHILFISSYPHHPSHHHHHNVFPFPAALRKQYNHTTVNMLFGVFFAFWRIFEIVTLVSAKTLPLLWIVSLTLALPDPNTRYARLLCRYVPQAKCPHTRSYPHSLHRLRPRSSLGHRNTLHLPPITQQFPLCRIHRSPLCRRLHRRRLRPTRCRSLGLHERLTRRKHLQRQWQRRKLEYQRTEHRHRQALRHVKGRVCVWNHELRLLFHHGYFGPFGWERSWEASCDLCQGDSLYY